MARRALVGAWVGGIALSCAAQALPPPPADPGREIECGLMIRYGPMIEGVPAPGLHILSRTAADPPLSATLSTNVVRVGCRRTIIIPGPFDDAVATRGIPLTIVEEGSGRVLVLELAAGHYRYQVGNGALTDEETSAVARRLAEFQARRQATPH